MSVQAVGAPPARDGGTAFPAGPGTVALLVGTALVVLAQLYAAIPLLEPVGASLGGEATIALSTVYSLCYASGFLLWGPLADRFGRRRVLTLGLTGLVVTTAACATAGSLAVLAVLRGAQGLAAASFAPVALAYLSEAVRPRLRALAIGAMSTAFLTAGIIGQVVAQTVAEQLGWSWLFAGSAVVLAGCVLLALVLVREPRGRTPSGDLGQQFTAVARLLGRRTVVFLCAAHVTLLLAFVAMYTALGGHLAGLGHGSDTVLLLRLVALPGMVMSLATGPLTRLLGGVAGVARAGYLLAAGGLLAQAAVSGSLVGTAVTSIVFVTGTALAVPSMITLFGEAAAPRRAGGMALNGLVLFTGASLGPIVARVDLPFAALLGVLAGLLTLAAASVTLASREPRPAQQEVLVR